jgi:hypothetical protein
MMHPLPLLWRRALIQGRSKACGFVDIFMRLFMKQPPLGLFAASRAIASGQLSPKAYMQQCIDLADQLEPALHAFVARTPTQQLLDGVGEGPWAGIPVGVKD